MVLRYFYYTLVILMVESGKIIIHYFPLHQGDKANACAVAHDEMARDEARHGRALEGFLKRYFA